MKVSGDRGLKAELNVTPLVDVVLVLLIIFMVVTPLLQKGRAVELPPARASLSEQRKTAHILVSITHDKRIMLDRSEVTMDDLTVLMGRLMAQDPNMEVFIKADARLHYGDVRKVMKVCHAAGAKRVALATRDEKKGT